jgi:hypothetical protein
VPSVILAAGLLVLLGLGLFVAGLITGATALYWACVAACAAAGLLLVVARRQISRAAPGAKPTTEIQRTSPTTDVTPAAPGEKAAPRSADPATPAPAGPRDSRANLPDPPVEDVEFTDLLLVVDLKDEVLVLDERPRYHLAGCVHVTGRTTIPLPVDEARRDGFTPCAVCEPDRNLAERARARKAARGS